MKNKLFIPIVLIAFALTYFLVTKPSISSLFKESSRHFNIISGSENKSLEPLLHDFGEKYNVEFHIQYKGSVDIMLELDKENIQYDAVWPANSIWITMGDKQRRVKHVKSIMSSPVVFGIRKSLAKKLNFIDKQVYTRDLLRVIQSKELDFIMTSATQSNSGASAYIGFLYALLGNPDFITKEHLHQSDLKRDITKLLEGIHRSSGSSGWLKDLYLKGDYNAMVNYEAMIIETNKELIAQGREPLYAIYPVDGTTLADSPLGFINSNNPQQEEIFLDLQEYLLSDQIQNDLKEHGRRTGFGGFLGDVNTSTFNPDWGIDADKVISPIPMPTSKVIREALKLYQTEFKKPSLTIFALDYSGSMEGKGIETLKKAMNMLLDQEESQKFMIQSGTQDKIIIIPFSSHVLNTWQTSGNIPEQLTSLNDKIRSLSPKGMTDIYSPVIKGLQLLQKEPRLQHYQPSIILMTDGESNVGSNFNNLKEQWQKIDKDIPVFAILFGKASKKQLNEITKLTRSRIFDGKNDLITAFRKAKGYN